MKIWINPNDKSRPRGSEFHCLQIFDRIWYPLNLILGYSHSAFTFGSESEIHSSKLNGKNYPQLLLLRMLEKLLVFNELELHMDGRECFEKVSLLAPHYCKNESEHKEKIADECSIIVDRSELQCTVNDEQLNDIQEKVKEKQELNKNLSVLDEFVQNINKCFIDAKASKAVIV